MNPRVLLADDHVLVAEGIRKLVESEFEVVGMVCDGRELLAKAPILKPDIVIIDIAMPGLNGIEAARRLRETMPWVKLVFVTQQIARQYVQAAFVAGAHAYVLKQSAATELQQAMRSVLHGQFYISPSIAGVLPSIRYLRSQESGSGLIDAGITPRQREVLQLVAEGKSIKEIAAALNISAKTVEFHKRGLMEELGLRSTAELTRYALEHGIVSLSS